MRRLFAIAVSVAFAAAVLSPLVRSPPRDSYPLSNYPMFSGRLDPVNDVRTAVGRDAAGERELLSPLLISGSDEAMMAVQTVGDAVAAGEAEALCRAIAARVAGSSRRHLAAVEVVTERHHAVDYFRGAREPLGAEVHARCEVPA